jgi:hypothetical protein
LEVARAVELPNSILDVYGAMVTVPNMISVAWTKLETADASLTQLDRVIGHLEN